MTRESVNVVASPTEFFREQITTAIARRKVAVSDDVEFYLVNLLCQFVAPPAVQTTNGQIDVLERPLALILKDALESSQEEQYKIYKSLGDTSLYLSGYFQDYFNRKCFDIEYFISLGVNAYSNVSAIARDHHRDKHFTELFTILAQDFASFVEIVAEVSDLLSTTNSINLLAVYDRWTKHPSDRLRRKLEQEGINPIPANTRTKQ